MTHSGNSVGIGVPIRAAQTIVKRFTEVNSGSIVFLICRSVEVADSPQSRRSLATGVGHKPNTLSDVGASNGGSWNACPFRM